MPFPPYQQNQNYCCMPYTAECRIIFHEVYYDDDHVFYVVPYVLLCFLAYFFRQRGELNHDGLVDGEAARGRRCPRARGGQGLPHGRLLHLLPPLLRCPGHELVSRLDAWDSPFSPVVFRCFCFPCHSRRLHVAFLENPWKAFLVRASSAVKRGSRRIKNGGHY